MIQPLHSGGIVKTMDADLRRAAATMSDRGKPPRLAIVEVEDTLAALDPRMAREVKNYVGGKRRVAEGLGIATNHLVVPPERLGEWIDVVNEDPTVDGAIVELPIPGLNREDTAILLRGLDPRKAVDNQGAKPAWGMGATSEAGIRLLDHHEFTGIDQHVLVWGSRGNVGGGIAGEYKRRDTARLSLVDRDGDGNSLINGEIVTPKELTGTVRSADIIVAATSQSGIVTPEIVRDGQAILSVGATEVHPGVRESAHTRALDNTRKGWHRSSYYPCTSWPRGAYCKWRPTSTARLYAVSCTSRR